MKALLVVLVALAASATARSKIGQIFSRHPVPDVAYYDCHGKPDGDYTHPPHGQEDPCTWFISCSNGRANAMPCADCNQHDHKCNGSPYLFWNGTSHCEWPALTTCDSGTAPTTPEPTPEPACDRNDEGQACEADDCEFCNWCVNTTNYYLRCDRTFPSNPKDPITGVWVREKCDDDLWWNPNANPQGGACDYWDNLDPAVQKKYKDDPECVHDPEVCEWGQDEADRCTGNHWYRPNGPNAVREDRTCNGDLVWDPATETCRNCDKVQGCSCPTPAP